MDASETDSRDQAGFRLGFWSAILTALCAAVGLGLGITTPVRSGPNCTSHCLTYPYTDSAAFVPRDYLWMYPALLLALSFMVLVACIYHTARAEQKLWSRLGLSFATIAAAVLTANYFIQLAVVQPSLLAGETAGLAPFVMYNPHGILLALEDLGYLIMGVAFVFTGLAVAGRGRLDRAARWLFLVGGLATVGIFIGLSFVYREELADKFEIIAITIDWTVLIVGGLLWGVLFRRAGRTEMPRRVGRLREVARR